MRINQNILFYKEDYTMDLTSIPRTLTTLEKLIEQAVKEGYIPVSGQNGYHSMAEAIGILRTEISANIPKSSK